MFCYTVYDGTHRYWYYNVRRINSISCIFIYIYMYTYIYIYTYVHRYTLSSIFLEICQKNRMPKTVRMPLPSKGFQNPPAWTEDVSEKSLVPGVSVNSSVNSVNEPTTFAANPRPPPTSRWLGLDFRTQITHCGLSLEMGPKFLGPQKIIVNGVNDAFGRKLLLNFQL